MVPLTEWIFFTSLGFLNVLIEEHESMRIYESGNEWELSNDVKMICVNCDAVDSGQNVLKCPLRPQP